eukprot:c5317_g1_i2.p1 GENE.c5317_g1_i2~~c5317_g1_i2.p1  ORF type:complete len:109 (+),score=8.38 c5317_g1_i2:338-664(+)
MTFGVHPNYQRGGVGAKLLREICQQLQQQFRCEHVHLHVKADNAAAISFYTKHNFYMRTLCRNHYFIDGQLCDAYWLMLKLPAVPVPATLASSMFTEMTKYLCNCLSN